MRVDTELNESTTIGVAPAAVSTFTNIAVTNTRGECVFACVEEPERLEQLASVLLQRAAQVRSNARAGFHVVVPIDPANEAHITRCQGLIHGCGDCAEGDPHFATRALAEAYLTRLSIAV